jgi:hypothetical protein
VLSKRALLVALIVAATALFVVGTTIERNRGDEHPAAEQSSESGEQGEAAHSEEGEEGPASEPARDEGSESEEILGIDPESAGLVAVAAVASLLLAAAVWRSPDRKALLLLVAAAMLAFAALDIREVVHQVDENRGGLAVLAALVAVLHLAAASVGGAAALGRGVNSTRR